MKTALERIRDGECGLWNQTATDYCKAGGVLNWYKIGIYQDHPNYGFPCVIGWIAELETYSTNCIFCGKEYGGQGEI